MALKPLGRIGTEAAKGNRQGIGKGGRQAGAIRSKEMRLGNVVPNSHNSCAPSLKATIEINCLEMYQLRGESLDCPTIVLMPWN